MPAFRRPQRRAFQNVKMIPVKIIRRAAESANHGTHRRPEIILLLNQTNRNQSGFCAFGKPTGKGFESKTIWGKTIVVQRRKAEAHFGRMISRQNHRTGSNFRRQRKGNRS